MRTYKDVLESRVLDVGLNTGHAYPSILSGDIGVSGFNNDNSYHAVVGEWYRQYGCP